MLRRLLTLASMLALASPAAATVGAQFTLSNTGGVVVLADFDGAPGLEICAMDLYSGELELRDSSGQLLGTLPRPASPSTELLARQLDGQGGAELLVRWVDASSSSLAAYSFVQDGKAGFQVSELWYLNPPVGVGPLGDLVALDPVSTPALWYREGPNLVLLDPLLGSEIWRSDNDPALVRHTVDDVSVIDLDGDGDDELMVWARIHGTNEAIVYFVDDPNPTPAPGTGVGGARATLFPAYPNPSGVEAQLSFALPQAGRVRLTIYDAAGRRVRTLLDEPREVGRHQLAWDGSDDQGARVASGAYFYELRTPGQPPQARKILQLR